MRFCNWPGCNRLTTGRYCEEHALEYEKQKKEKGIEYNRSRVGATKAGYGIDWQRARRAYLSKNPLCEMCKTRGKIVPAILVHHVKEISQGGDRLSEDNMMALCNDCHEKIHSKNRWKKTKPRQG